ncbi:hypothetical protein E4T39_03799 [Aureobasidium subglaciale]|nr:hypothetical protein E4T39_03799 [Aureobasidium subglaciale]
MPVAGVLSLGRRVQYATRTRHVHSCSIGRHARRSFFISHHVKSDNLSADKRLDVLRKCAVDDTLHRSVARHQLRPHKGSDRRTSTWNLSSDPKHDALKRIVARRLDHLATVETLDDTELPLTTQEHATLESLDCTHHHVDYYANILSNQDSLFAARLLTASHAPPFFVYYDFLARVHLRPEALRLLLDHLPTWDPDTFRVSHDIITPVFERLLYHCRRVWPDAIPTMAAWLTNQLRLSDARLARIQDSGLNADDNELISYLTSRYNHALRLLSQPSHISPFKNTIFQEAAQATILKHMADHDPTFAINRQGYRAVTRVQLAAKKSPSEREWARLKSPSWPPWKEDRTGMDAHITLDYGVSRAHQILLRMQEAGYPLKDWDRVAMIYAGWDTDRSPTIQKRIFLDDLPRSDIAKSLWIARIKTTRTAQQAWACFLAYQDEHLPSDHRIYHAMFEVLIQERKRVMLGSKNIGHEVDRDNMDSLYPGDTMEIGSPPSSTHQLTYIRAEMPSVQQLYDHMREDGKYPSDDTLAMLLDSAESLAEGLVYLETGAQDHRIAISALLHGSKDYQDLHKLPDKLFTAYTRLLCRFPHTPLDTELKMQWRYGSIIKSNFDLRQPLARALYLLVQQKRTYLPAWNCVFSALARRTAPTLASSWRSLHLRGEESLKEQNELYDKIFAFNLTRQVSQTMWENDLTLDEDAFLSICIVAEHAANAVHTIFRDYGYRQEHASESTARLITHADSMFQHGPGWMKEQFWTLTEGAKDSKSSSPRTESSAVELPQLYTVPRPAMLHAYVRALGLLRDYEGLKELVTWMVRYRKDLAKRCAMDRRGHVLMRRALIALRVFLEDRWELSKALEEDVDEEADDEVTSSASAETIEEIKALVESVQRWGGWPSDEEVEMYVVSGLDNGRQEQMSEA